MSKIIFIDIDGVLNSFDSMWALHAAWKDGIGVSRDAYGQLFDQRCVTWLKHIVDRTGAEIVISSTWRSKGLHHMKQMWSDRSLPGEVIGVTPHIVDGASLFLQYPDISTSWRGFEIQQWLNNNLPERYVILDDESDMLPHQTLVQCKSEFGITKIEANKVIALLNGN